MIYRTYILKSSTGGKKGMHGRVEGEKVAAGVFFNFLKNVFFKILIKKYTQKYSIYTVYVYT